MCVNISISNKNALCTELVGYILALAVPATFSIPLHLARPISFISAFVFAIEVPLELVAVSNSFIFAYGLISAEPVPKPFPISGTLYIFVI